VSKTTVVSGGIADGTIATADIADSAITAAKTSGVGGLVPLIKTTISSATAAVEFNSTYVTTTYNTYKVIIRDLVPATDNADLYAYVTNDNFSSYNNSAGDYMSVILSSDSGDEHADNTGNSNRSQIYLTASVQGLGTATGESGYFEITFNPHGSLHKNFLAFGAYKGSSAESVFSRSAHVHTRNTTAINGIRFQMSSGNIASGVFNLYGILEA
tara:strand:+ start:25 stop:666 length:642 start_codon:yes stop_codon:yes gene_type:complete